MDEGTPPEPEGSFVDYQTTMVKYSKAIAITAQEMVSALNFQSRMTGPGRNISMLLLMIYVLSTSR